MTAVWYMTKRITSAVRLRMPEAGFFARLEADEELRHVRFETWRIRKQRLWRCNMTAHLRMLRQPSILWRIACTRRFAWRFAVLRVTLALGLWVAPVFLS